MTEHGNLSLYVENFEEVKEIRRTQLASKANFEDKQFPSDLGIAELSNRVVSWMRIGEFDENAYLMKDGDSNKASIVEGKLANPHFAAVMASVANHPKLLNYIMPKEQQLKGPNYCGLFYCRFWKMGKWVYVYIDDKLPFIEEKRKDRPKSAKKIGKTKNISEQIVTSSRTITSVSEKCAESKSLSLGDGSSTKKEDSRKSCVKSIDKNEGDTDTENTKINSEKHIEVPALHNHSDNTRETSHCDQKNDNSSQGSKSDSRKNLKQNSEAVKDEKMAEDAINFGNKFQDDSLFSYAISEKNRTYYWASLLEKAYAKFCGGYPSSKEKSLKQILLDMTGGFIEKHHALSTSRISFLDLKSHCDRHNLIFAITEKIPGAEICIGDHEELKTEEKSTIEYCIVTGVQFVDFRRAGFDKMIGFVRLRSSSGSIQWKEPWIEAIKEWQFVPQLVWYEQKLETRSNAEFYLTFENFQKAFPTTINVCTVPDGINFNCEGFVGSWTTPPQKIGKLNLHKSPQHKICVRDPNEPDDSKIFVEMVTSLILDTKSKSKGEIGNESFLLVYQLERIGDLPFNFDYFRFRKPVAILSLEPDSAARLRLQQGTYLAVLAISNNSRLPVQYNYLLRVTVPAKFYEKSSPPELRESFIPNGDSIDFTNYFDRAEAIEEVSPALVESIVKNRKNSEKIMRKEKGKSKKKKMKR